MAIKIKLLEQVSKAFTDQTSTYRDLALDIQQVKVQPAGFANALPKTDIKANYNVEAISNSLINLFNTVPGQRFLYPQYGLNLRSFLFDQVSENAAQIIGSKMLNAITAYEPRVRVQNINVVVDNDRQQYLFTININIPSLNVNNNINTILDVRSQSFILLHPQA
jgi:phage baseplate assembly protein W